MQVQTIPPLWRNILNYYQIICTKDLILPLETFGNFLIQLAATLIIMRLTLRTSIEPELKSHGRTTQIAFGYLDPSVLLNSGLYLLL